MAEKNSRRNETTDALFDAILSLESREECYAFFEDLCTVKEISFLLEFFSAIVFLLIITAAAAGKAAGAAARNILYATTLALQSAKVKTCE